MRYISGLLKSETGNILPFIIVMLVVAAVALPALLNLSFESVRSAHEGQDEMQRFYAADVGIEDALFKLSEQTVSVPLDYKLEDVNGYEVSVNVVKAAEEGKYQVTSTATREFEPNTVVQTIVAMYQLIITSSTGGNVTLPGEGTFVYPANTTVSLQAIADFGYDFVNWTGDTGSMGNPGVAGTTIYMDGDYAIQANFAVPPPDNYWLTTTTGLGGTVQNPGIGSFEYAEGWVVDLLAVADSGYRFDAWTGDTGTIDDTGSANATIEMWGNYTIQSNFVREFTLTITSSDGGSVITPGEGVFTYDIGTVVSLVAANEVDYEFVNWTGDTGTMGDPNSASTTITMSGDYAIQANFEETSLCRPCFDYAMASLSETEPLVVANNGVVDGDIYGKAGIELVNGAIIDGNAYADGDLIVNNTSEIRGNAHATGDVYIYNNGEVHGNVYADGDVTVYNNGEVNGDIWATGSVNIGFGVIITGTIHEYCDPSELPPMPTLDPPTPTEIEQLRADYESDAKAGGTYSGNYVVPKNQTVDLGPLHIDGDLTIRNGATVNILGAIYVTGEIDILNNCTVSGTVGALVAEWDISIQNNTGLDPVDLPVIMSVYGDIDCVNNSDIDAALYAPNGEITLLNNTNVYGALVGDEITTMNNFNVTYAPELGSHPGLPPCGCP